MDLKDLTIEALRGKKVAVHCKTQEEWDEVSSILQRDMVRPSDCSLCINIWMYGYAVESHYKALDYTIITAADFIAANKKEVVTELVFKGRVKEMQLDFDGEYVRVEIVDGHVASNFSLNKEMVARLVDFLNQLP